MSGILSSSSLHLSPFKVIKFPPSYNWTYRLPNRLFTIKSLVLNLNLWVPLSSRAAVIAFKWTDVSSVHKETHFLPVRNKRPSPKPVCWNNPIAMNFVHSVFMKWPDLRILRCFYLDYLLCPTCDLNLLYLFLFRSCRYIMQKLFRSSGIYPDSSLIIIRK